MNESSDIELQPSIDNDSNISYSQFDKHSTLISRSSLVLSSCSNDEELNNDHSLKPLQWKRQQILNSNCQNA